MADGKWRITRLTGLKAGGILQGSPDYKVDEIRVWQDPERMGETPRTLVTDYALCLIWPDQKTDYYPWNNILKAEYTPPTP